MLLAVRCPVCGAAGRAPCAGCAALLRRAPSLPPVAGIDRCVAFLDYSGPARELVARLKYRNARAAVGFLARAMATLARPGDAPDLDLDITPRPGPRPGPALAFDVVTWVPTTAKRRRRRGFDQAELLARAVAARLGIPCRGLLLRLPGPAQTGRPLGQRRAGPAFVPRGPGPAPARVLLVDDVVTSGASITNAARCLRAGGAHHVHAVVAARTPPPRR